MLGLAIAATDRGQVLALPGLAVVYLDVPDQLLASTLHRYGQPGKPTIQRLDSISIAPIPDRVLHIVQEHECIDLMDEIEESAPRKIIRLNDSNGPHTRTCRSGRKSTVKDI